MLMCPLERAAEPLVGPSSLDTGLARKEMLRAKELFGLPRQTDLWLSLSSQVLDSVKSYLCTPGRHGDSWKRGSHTWRHQPPEWQRKCSTRWGNDHFIRFKPRGRRLPKTQGPLPHPEWTKQNLELWLWPTGCYWIGEDECLDPVTGWRVKIEIKVVFSLLY